jgi:hypothetical protein
VIPLQFVVTKIVLIVVYIVFSRCAANGIDCMVDKRANTGCQVARCGPY